MKTLYLHIGYPKTATTTFQKFLYPAHSQIKDIKANSLSFFSKLHYSRENYFKRESLQTYKELSSLIIDKDFDKFVISSESLTSFSMYYQFFPKPYIWSAEPNSIARKLKTVFLDSTVFDNVKIIISIRKQDEMLKSLYAQTYNLVFKRFKETDTFKKFLKYSIELNNDNFIIDTLHYNEILKVYEELFGIENICVLVFEELQKHRITYIKKLCSFMEIDFNEAEELISNNNTNKKSCDKEYISDERNIIEILSYYKNKYLNKNFGLMESPLLSPLKKIYIPGRKLKNIFIDDLYDKELSDLYSLGNQEVSSRYNLKLDHHDYYL